MLLDGQWHPGLPQVHVELALFIDPEEDEASRLLWVEETVLLTDQDRLLELVDKQVMGNQGDDGGLAERGRSCLNTDPELLLHVVLFLQRVELDNAGVSVSDQDLVRGLKSWQ